MLELKNIIEDIVIEEIEELDESKSGMLSKNQKIEIASYVLNRMPPMYITSNKGFANTIIKYRNDPQFFTDILMKINEGLHVIKKTSIDNINDVELDMNIPYYLLPKIYGRIISSRTLMPVENAKLSLYIDSNLAELLYSDWSNPLEIHTEDNGVFSFAPKPLEVIPPFEPKTFHIKILVEAGEITDEKFVMFEADPMFLHNIDMDFNENILEIGDFYIKC